MPTLTSTELKRLHRDWRRKTAGRVALILEDVQSPFNVGSMIRTAAAYRVDHVWLVGSTATPTNPKTQKTALGCDRFLAFTSSRSIGDAVQEAHQGGYQVVGIELAATAEPLHEVALGPDTCLVLGHEDRGLSTTCLSLCDRLAFLPQLGKVGSLNVATAAALAIYEVRRRVWA